MRKYRPEQQQDPGFGIGFPVCVIAVSILAIIGYLVVLGVQIPPPQKRVYLATDQ